jgi:hypothetical protein
MLKQIWRLLSTIAVQKSIENVWKICLMVYQTQEKFPKIIPSHFVYSLRLLFILARQKSTENKRKICLMIYQTQEKFQKNIPSRLKHIERLFSIIALQTPVQQIIPSHLKHIERLLPMNAFQKSIDNVRMTCPMIYQTQEKTSESHQAYSEATFDYSTTEPGQKMSDYLA